MNAFEQINQKNFLAQHWEKKPQVFKNFLRNAENLLDENDLLDMAFEEYFESRVVAKVNQKYHVAHGPFKEIAEIQNFDEWTLVNHNVDLYSKELMQIKKSLEFLPAWLFDDAMTTYSNAGSSIGAHIDNYNVFIIQLKGKRKWNLQYDPNPKYQEGLEIKILEEFKADETHILIPGDMIYIPPHVAHEGISETDSLSLSLGFKSMEDKAIAEQLAIELVNNFQSDEFYKTSFATAVEDPYLIDEKIINDIKERLMKKVFSDRFFENAILKFTSTSKRPTQANENPLDSFLKTAETNPLFKDEFVRISAIKKGNGIFKVAVNDFDFLANTEQYEFIKKLAYLTCEDEIYLSDHEQHADLLYKLNSQGMLFFNQED